MNTANVATVATIATPVVVAVAPAVTEVFRAEMRTEHSPCDDSPEALSALCAERLYELRSVEGEAILTEAQLRLAEEKFNVVLRAAIEIEDLHIEDDAGRVGPSWRRCDISVALLKQAREMREEWQRAREVRRWACLSPEAIAYAARGF